MWCVSADEGTSCRARGGVDLTTVPDPILDLARQKIVGDPDEQVPIRKKTLALFVGEIETLRAGLNAVDLPDKNKPGQFHAKASETERAAAFAVMPRTGTQRMKVLRAVLNSPDGLTDQEISERLQMRTQSETPRRYELMWGGWVRDSGRTRATGNGGEGIVWVPTDKAIAQRERINN